MNVFINFNIILAFIILLILILYIVYGLYSLRNRSPPFPPPNDNPPNCSLKYQRTNDQSIP